jgi:hypothetical protein
MELPVASGQLPVRSKALTAAGAEFAEKTQKAFFFACFAIFAVKAFLNFWLRLVAQLLSL